PFRRTRKIVFAQARSAHTSQMKWRSSVRKDRIAALRWPCFSALLLPLGAPGFRAGACLHSGLMATELFRLFVQNFFSLCGSAGRQPATELFRLFAGKLSRAPAISRWMTLRCAARASRAAEL